MKFKFILAAAAAAALIFSGCASMPYGKNINEFTISPDKGIKPGTVVTALVKTTDEVAAVYGSLEVFGSPTLKLKFDEKKQAWIFRYMIPLTYVIPRGEYTVKVEVVTKAGDKSFAQKKVSTY